MKRDKGIRVRFTEEELEKVRKKWRGNISETVRDFLLAEVSLAKEEPITRSNDLICWQCGYESETGETVCPRHNIKLVFNES